MYGESRLNAHHTLRYGYTIEFLRRFRWLTYGGIEVPAMFIRPFHVFIRPIVDSLINDQDEVSKLQKRLGIYTMADVQKALMRVPRTIRNLSVYAHRRALLLPGRLAAFAAERLGDHRVILLDYASEDQRVLAQFDRLPRHFTIFDFKAEVARVHVSSASKKKYKQLVAKLTQNTECHPVFSHPNFEPWLYRHAMLAVRYVDVLERLVRQQPIGLMLDTAEIINPAATLVLLARKYGLPFIIAPHVLITDRTFIPARATHYFAWGQYYREWMVERGIPSAKISVVGNVRMDQLHQKPACTQGKWRQERGIPENIPLVAVATQPFPEQVQTQVVHWLKRVADVELPFFFLLKRHPYDRHDYSCLARHPRIRILDTQDRPLELLAYCDLLATISSNMGIEAALFQKAVLVLQPDIPYMYEFHNNAFNAHLASAQAGPVIRNPEQWVQVLKRYAGDETYRARLVEQSQRFLKRTLNTNRPASDLVAEMIGRLLGSDKYRSI